MNLLADGRRVDPQFVTRDCPIGIQKTAINALLRAILRQTGPDHDCTTLKRRDSRGELIPKAVIVYKEPLRRGSGWNGPRTVCERAGENVPTIISHKLISLAPGHNEAAIRESRDARIRAYICNRRANLEFTPCRGAIHAKNARPNLHATIVTFLLRNP